MKEIATRMKKRTPKFFRKVRNVGLTVAGVSAAILSAPISLPAALITAAGYAAVAGTVMSCVSQAAVKNDH